VIAKFVFHLAEKYTSSVHIRLCENAVQVSNAYC